MSPSPELSRILLPLLLAAPVGYLLGAVPFGYLVARSKGVNIFEQGSKNPGATNVRRVLGRRAGNLVFILDLCKGAGAGAWPLLFFREEPVAKLIGAVGVVFALIGHSFSCFTHFKGGKGVATGAGGFFVMMPVVTLIAAAVWTVTFFSSRYVSLASISSAATIPVAACLLREPPVLVTIAAAVAVFVILRHRANLVRLARGTENRWTKRREAAP